MCREACVPSASSADAIVGADSSRGFELLSADGGGVLRCSLVRIVACAALGAAAAQLLHVNVHHVAFDGASTGVFVGELGTMHEGLGHGDATAACALLPLVVLQYVDYALWQRSEALAPQLASHRSYWRSALREGDLPALELPLDEAHLPRLLRRGEGARRRRGLQ